MISFYYAKLEKCTKQIAKENFNLNAKLKLVERLCLFYTSAFLWTFWEKVLLGIEEEELHEASILLSLPKVPAHRVMKVTVEDDAAVINVPDAVDVVPVASVQYGTFAVLKVTIVVLAFPNTRPTVQRGIGDEVHDRRPTLVVLVVHDGRILVVNVEVTANVHMIEVDSKCPLENGTESLHLFKRNHIGSTTLPVTMRVLVSR